MITFYQVRRLCVTLLWWAIAVGTVYSQENEICKQLFVDYDTKVAAFIQHVQSEQYAANYIQAANTLCFFIHVCQSFAPQMKSCPVEAQKKFDQFIKYLIDAYDQLDGMLFMHQEKKEHLDNFVDSIERIQTFFDTNLLFLHTLEDGTSGRIIIPLPISSSSQSSGSSSIVSIIVVVVSALASFAVYFALRDVFTMEHKMKLKQLQDRRNTLEKNVKRLKEAAEPSSFLFQVLLQRKDITNDLKAMKQKLNKLNNLIQTELRPIADVRGLYEKKINKKTNKELLHKFKEDIERHKKELIAALDKKIGSKSILLEELRAIYNEQSACIAQQRAVYEDLCGLKRRVHARLEEIESKKTASCSKELIRKLKEWCNLSAWNDSEAPLRST